MKIHDDIVLRESIMHPCYFVGRPPVGIDAVICGIGTWILAQRFRAGETIAEIAADYDLAPEQLETALRFEMHSRSARTLAVGQAWAGR